MTGRRRAVWWVGLLVVVAVALALGARQPGPAPGPAARIAALDAELRCPSCDGLSVAQSDAASAAVIRRTVADDVHAGRSDAQIVAALEAGYGPSILLRPPTHGTEALVWLVPALAVAGGVVGVATVLWRRRRTVAVTVDDEDRRRVADALAAEAR